MNYKLIVVLLFLILSAYSKTSNNEVLEFGY